MYLIDDTAAVDMHPTEGRFAGSSAKDVIRVKLDGHREFLANDGLIMRSQNETDGVTATFSTSIIYHD